MTHVVEDGTGVPLANVYANESFVRNYLRLRNKHTTWDAASDAVRDAAMIAATSYIDKRYGLRFKGRKEFLNLGRPAESFLFIEANTLNGNTVTIGSTVYTFGNTVPSAFDVLIGADVEETAANLAKAINDSGTPGTEYGVGTTAHPDVLADEQSDGGHVHVFAKVSGEAGNDIVTATDMTASEGSWDGATLHDGSDTAEQPLEFPRLNLVSKDGTFVTGVPTKLKQAMAEYAFRALTAELLPDPTTDATGRVVVEKSEKVGPIEESTKYSDSAVLEALIKAYPAADLLLADYLKTGARIFRG